MYKSEKAYILLLQRLAAISGIRLWDIKEHWLFDEKKQIIIRISYCSGDKHHTIWTERSGDFLKLLILHVLNRQLDLNSIKFEYSHQQERIYFISESEKSNLEYQGIIFDPVNEDVYFDLLLMNAALSLENSEDDPAYALLTDLNRMAVDYWERNSRKKELGMIQATIRAILLEKISWQQVSTRGLDPQELYKLVLKS